MVLLSVSLWRAGATYIEDVSSTLMGIRELVGGDSEHYLAIADTLREGNLSMDYVTPTGAADRAHRQPGYPAVIALAESFGLTGAPDLARVNLAIVVASLWIAFFGARIATGSALAGLLAAGVVYDARFLYDIATERLLTEPTYVAVTLGAVAACLSYVGRPGPLSLLLVAALGGLAYLVRVNGLIMTTSIAIALVVADVNRARRRNPGVPANDLVLHLPLAAYAAAVALFVVVTIPSWLPRAIHAGNPVYHGYLPNYLWVDEHDRAHTAGPPRFTFETYAAEHDAADAARRMAWGLRRVFWETPRDKFGVVTTVALAASAVVVVALPSAPGIVIASAGVLQALPLAWTAVANPVRRIPAAALLPFASLLVAAAVAAVLRRVHPPTPARPGTEREAHE